METLILSLAFFFAAVLYSSVGHAGASAYLAAMALVGIASSTMRPTALALNILVSSLVIYRFNKSELIAWKKIVPFILGSIPAAFIGGSLNIDTSTYNTLIGVVLIIVALQLVFNSKFTDKPTTEIYFIAAILVGITLGFLSGLTGTGGGIFLTPLLILAGWATTRQAAGLSAVFIFSNSLSGLIGNYSNFKFLPAELPLWLLVVASGALIGSYFGANKLPTIALRRALGFVLLIASGKLLFL